MSYRKNDRWKPFEKSLGVPDPQLVFYVLDQVVHVLHHVQVGVLRRQLQTLLQQLQLLLPEHRISVLVDDRKEVVLGDDLSFGRLALRLNHLVVGVADAFAFERPGGLMLEHILHELEHSALVVSAYPLAHGPAWVLDRGLPLRLVGVLTSLLAHAVLLILLHLFFIQDASNGQVRLASPVNRPNRLLEPVS